MRLTRRYEAGNKPKSIFYHINLLTVFVLLMNCFYISRKQRFTFFICKIKNIVLIMFNNNHTSFSCTVKMVWYLVEVTSIIPWIDGTYTPGRNTRSLIEILTV